MNSKGLGGDNSAFIKGDSSKIDWRQDLPGEITVSSLVHSGRFEENCLQIVEIPQRLIFQVFDVHFMSFYLPQELFFNLWILVDVVNHHHCRVLCGVCTCRVKIGKIVDKVVNELFLSLSDCFRTTLKIKRL